MYFDIFLQGNWVVIDPGTDQANGVHMDGPGPKRAVVYAMRQLNPGRVQCLVTPAQLAQLNANGVSYIHFSTLPAGETGQGGGPAHVFGRFAIQPGSTADEVIIYRPGSSVPEVVTGGAP